MNLELVTDEAERKQRRADFLHTYGHIASLFHAYLRGLDQFSGRRVLEIGGTNSANMASYFFESGACYRAVRLEINDEHRPDVTQMNFMHIPGENRYDLVISRGVFEKKGIERAPNGYGYGITLKEPEEYLEKLLGLVSDDGLIVVGTSIDPCLIGSELTASRTLIRARPFCLRIDPGRFYKDAELLVLGKHEVVGGLV